MMTADPKKRLRPISLKGTEKSADLSLSQRDFRLAINPLRLLT